MASRSTLDATGPGRDALETRRPNAHSRQRRLQRRESTAVAAHARDRAVSASRATPGASFVTTPEQLLVTGERLDGAQVGRGTHRLEHTAGDLEVVPKPRRRFRHGVGGVPRGLSSFANTYLTPVASSRAAARPRTIHALANGTGAISHPARAEQAIAVATQAVQEWRHRFRTGSRMARGSS